jgi:hypothetical protein
VSQPYAYSAFLKRARFDKVTGSSAHERFVFTGKHGTRRRGINVGYENILGNYTSVSLVFGFRPEQQTCQTIFHEMVHVLHGSLISQHCGHDVWEAVTSGVRELFAMMVDRSSTQGMQNIPDTNTSVERIWYPPIYAYYQWRMHEEMAKEGYELSEEQLCVLNQRIQNEMHTMFQMSAKGVIYDISETARRVEINPLNPSDGIVYCIGEINSHNQHRNEGPTSVTDQKEQSIHPSALFETKWGKGWVYNPEAIDMLYAAMITSAHGADTEAVKKAIKELFAALENNPGLPKEVLSKYGIPHSQLITQAQNTNSSR